MKLKNTMGKRPAQLTKKQYLRQGAQKILSTGKKVGSVFCLCFVRELVRPNAHLGLRCIFSWPLVSQKSHQNELAAKARRRWYGECPRSLLKIRRYVLTVNLFCKSTERSELTRDGVRTAWENHRPILLGLR